MGKFILIRNTYDILDRLKFLGLRKVYYLTKEIFSLINYTIIPLSVNNDIIYTPKSIATATEAKIKSLAQKINCIDNIYLNGNRKYFTGISDIDFLIVFKKKASINDLKLIKKLLNLHPYLIPHHPFFITLDLLLPSLNNYLFLYTPPMNSLYRKNNSVFRKYHPSPLQRSLCILEYLFINRMVIANRLRNNAKDIDLRFLLKVINHRLNNMSQYPKISDKFSRKKIETLSSLCSDLRQKVSLKKFNTNQNIITISKLIKLYKETADLEEKFLDRLSHFIAHKTFSNITDFHITNKTIQTKWGFAVFIKNSAEYRNKPLFKLIKAFGIPIFDMNLYRYLSFMLENNLSVLTSDKNSKPILLRKKLMYKWWKNMLDHNLLEFMPPPNSILNFLKYNITYNSFRTGIMDFIIWLTIKTTKL